MKLYETSKNGRRNCLAAADGATRLELRNMEKLFGFKLCFQLQFEMEVANKKPSQKL